MNMCMHVYMYVTIYVHLLVCLLARLSVCLFVSLFVCLFVISLRVFFKNKVIAKLTTFCFTADVG